MVNGALPVFVAVTVLAALVVPVVCDAYVNVGGLIDAIGAGPGGGGAGVHPDSRAEADVVPSLTVTWHVGELYGEVWTLNAPFPSVVDVTPPGLIVIAWLASAPLPSTRSCDPDSSARLIVTAAWALVARAPSVTSESATKRDERSRMMRPFLELNADNNDTPKATKGTALVPPITPRELDDPGLRPSPLRARSKGVSRFRRDALAAIGPSPTSNVQDG